MNFQTVKLGLITISIPSRLSFNETIADQLYNMVDFNLLQVGKNDLDKVLISDDVSICLGRKDQGQQRILQLI